MASSQHQMRFPNESPTYRAARDKLLEAEIDLRRATEAVAAQRRALPLGGEVPEDYVFDEIIREYGKGQKRQVRMSDLFTAGKDILVLYSFMYGPDAPRPCPSCTSILDGMDGESIHINQRVNFAVVAKSPIERIREFAKERGWRNLRLLSSNRCSYNQDYHGENDDGDQMPAMNVFVRRNGRVHHFWNTEMMFTPADAGQDMRHVDMIWPLWSVFDLTPDGRGEKWNPKLAYTPSPSTQNTA